jgi:hypothetical protein
MKIVRFAAVVFILSAVNATTSDATETITGRWALDESSCTRFFGTAAQSPLVVTDTALRWSDDVCRIERTYKTGDTVHIQAICWGDGGGHSIPVSLRPHSGRLSVTWDHGARGELRRCP